MAKKSVMSKAADAVKTVAGAALGAAAAAGRPAPAAPRVAFRTPILAAGIATVPGRAAVASPVPVRAPVAARTAVIAFGAVRVLAAGAVERATPADAGRFLPVWPRSIWVTHASSLVGG